MTQTTGNFTIAPNSVDTVFRTDSGLVFSVNGSQSEISILQGDNSFFSELLLTGNGGVTAVLFRGGIAEIAARLEEIHGVLVANTRKPDTPALKSKPLLAAVAIGAVLLGAGYFHPQSTEFLRGLEIRPHTLAPVPEQYLAPKANAPQAQVPSIFAPARSGASMSDVVKAPEIFDIPGEAMPDPSDETKLFTPAIVSDLKSMKTPPKNEGQNNDQTPKPEGEKAHSNAQAGGILGKLHSMSEPAITDPAQNETEVKGASASVAAAPPVIASLPVHAPIALEPGNGPVRETRVSADETGDISEAISSGEMTPEKAQSFLTAIERLKSNDPAVTKAMLEDLPEDVAAHLASTGLLDELLSADNNGREYRIIRLPESVVELYRGTDGIATIPEQLSWASTGNYVRLPLPGGGDVKRPEHMEDFGLSLM